MLVLSRFSGESLTFTVPGYPPFKVWLTIDEYQGKLKIRAGIDAPKEVAVARTDNRHSGARPTEP